MNEALCSFDDCRNPARRRGLCWAHRKQEDRNPEGRKRETIERRKANEPRWASVQRAALQYANDTESPVKPGESPKQAAARADYRLRKAVYRYFEPLRARLQAKLDELVRQTTQV